MMPPFLGRTYFCHNLKSVEYFPIRAKYLAEVSQGILTEEDAKKCTCAPKILNSLLYCAVSYIIVLTDRIFCKTPHEIEGNA